MTYVIALLLALIMIAYVISWLVFAYQHPYRTLSAIALGLATAPNENAFFAVLMWFFLFWLFTSRDGLIVLGCFMLGFWLSSRNKY